ncbi:MAG: proline--tRNA ligase, partial [Methanosarcina sp.]
VQFTDKTGKLDYVWATSWGVSTRLMGAIIMAHADNNGLVLPPKLAPIQVVIIPIYKKEEQLSELSEAAIKIKKSLEALGISVKYDDRDNYKPGFKFADYELKGVPVRLAIGPRDLENKTIEVARRDTLTKETIPIDSVTTFVPALLEEIQKNIFTKAFNFRKENTYKVDKWEDFIERLESTGGFILAHWDGTVETEEKIKEETKATIRCIPFDSPEEEGKCIYTGKPSKRRVLFARSY